MSPLSDAVKNSALAARRKVRPFLDLSSVKQDTCGSLPSFVSEISPGSPASEDSIPWRRRATEPSPRDAAEGEMSPSWFFELGEVLGTGSYSVVKRARRKVDGSALAVKCTLTTDEDVRQAIRSEFDIMRSLQHASIVHAEDLLENSSGVWLGLELCEGGDLEALVEDAGPLAGSAARRLFKQLLEGVDFLHQKRIVHRDVKPPNLLLSADRLTLKLADLNSAKHLGGGKAGTGAMLSFRGTRLYSAPELVLGLDWNERVDVWAAGLCCYFMLQARLPFKIEKQQVKTSLAAGELPPIRWEGAPQDHRDIVGQCLTVDMRQRPSAMELLQHRLFLEPKKTRGKPRRKTRVKAGPQQEPQCATVDDVLCFLQPEGEEEDMYRGYISSMRFNSV